MEACAAQCIDTQKVDRTMEALPDVNDIIKMADIFKAMGDPSRLKIVMTLLNQEHCVCEIARICNQTNSAVSHQLRILRTLKIVKNRRAGKIVYYAIDDDHVVALINMSLTHVRH